MHFMCLKLQNFNVKNRCGGAVSWSVLPASGRLGVRIPAREQWAHLWFNALYGKSAVLRSPGKQVREQWANLYGK